MSKIKRFSVENMSNSYCITDNMKPRFSFYIESEESQIMIKNVNLKLNGWEINTDSQISITYNGKELEPYTVYEARLKVELSNGEFLEDALKFETGRLNSSWIGKWITNGKYVFKEKNVSPKPMLFRKKLKIDKEIECAKIYSTAFGVYALTINDKKVGEDYFAPGFTSYKNQMQYQIYDITKDFREETTLVATVSGGWAVGRFTYKNRNRVYADRQAFLCEIHIRYKDGTEEIIATDESWEVAMRGNLLEAEFYNGEVVDSRIKFDELTFEKASEESLRFTPNLIANYGASVKEKENFDYVTLTKSKSGKLIYDFGQNLAGIIKAKIKGEKGQKIVIKHAEILMDTELFTKPLRTAKQEIVFICDGTEQEYSPKHTYMGFRYISVEGIEPENIDIKAVALYSDMLENGSFECSNEMLNKLQANTVWGAKSNFVDIPTDCPQRDERMGWTGDIALFSPTASYNFVTSRFYEKWLLDVKAEQTKGGGIPVTVPLVRVPMQWEIMVPMAVDHWGDACILVPWAEYRARGDIGILKDMYPTMKKYMKACEFWAKLLSVGKRRYIWRFLHHYGDWLAPNVGLWGWMGRGKWTATACMAHSSGILAEIANIIGEESDAKYFETLAKKAADAYRTILMDKDCKLKNEFQTGYVLPLHYGILNYAERVNTANHLAKLVKENNYHIGTGFPGTPYILFALADNGFVDEAFKMLLTETCPSWLFQVKAGATTLWERWDALREDGSSNTGDDDGTNGMVSFNHFANGAVCDFFYKRIAGIEAISGGYKTFKIEPIIGGDLRFAKGEVISAYGKIVSDWKIENKKFAISVEIPVNSECTLIMPSGNTKNLKSGKYSFEEVI